MTQLSTLEQIRIVANGSPQFNAKLASNTGDVRQDAVLTGHAVFAECLSGIGDLFNKAAGCVNEGWPAKYAIEALTQEYDLHPELREKLASCMDGISTQILKECVKDSFQRKVQAKMAEAASRQSLPQSVKDRLEKLRSSKN